MNYLLNLKFNTMKNARRLLALLLFTTLLYSCTSDDLIEEEATKTEQHFYDENGNEIFPINSVGDDGDGDLDDDDETGD